MSASATVTAFAPASIGNVGVGFDMLGLAVSGVGDRVSVRRVEQPSIRVAEVRDQGGAPHPSLTTEPERNTASIAATALWKFRGSPGGLELVIHKGIPLQSGMGSSAASAVAAVVAANALLESPLELLELMPFALEGEQFASGGLHADNVAPSLLGGLVLCPTVLLPGAINLTPPLGISSVLLHPALQVDTAVARRGLSQTCTMNQWLAQQGYLAAFIAACEQNDHELIGQSLRDVIIEPQRASLVPPFGAVKAAATENGALGCSLSGSGPSVFALCPDSMAPQVRRAMEEACRGAGFDCESWVSPMNSPGARVINGR